MSTLQKILFSLILVAIIVLIIVTWGSIASALFAFCLVQCLAMYLLNRFVNTDRENDFQNDDIY